MYWLTPNEEVARIIKVIVGAGFQVGNKRFDVFVTCLVLFVTYQIVTLQVVSVTKMSWLSHSFVFSSGDRQHHTTNTARGRSLGRCDKNRSLQPSFPTGFHTTIFKIRNSVKWPLQLWTPYFELNLYHQSISPCHDNTSPVWDEVGTHVEHHFG